jgi:hypothetical protein
MRRLAIVLLLAGSSPHLVYGQSAASGPAGQHPPPPVGSTVRITIAPSGGRHSGTLLVWEQDSIWLRKADSSTISLATSRVTDVEVSAGSGSRAGRGALIGGGVGLLLGTGGAIAVASCDGFLCGDLPPGTIVLGLVVTGGVGALLGAGVGSLVHYQRWQRYSGPSLVVAPGPRGVRVGLTIPLP